MTCVLLLLRLELERQQREQEEREEQERIAAEEAEQQRQAEGTLAIRFNSNELFIFNVIIEFWNFINRVCPRVSS